MPFLTQFPVFVSFYRNCNLYTNGTDIELPATAERIRRWPKNMQTLFFALSNWETITIRVWIMPNATTRLPCSNLPYRPISLLRATTGTPQSSYTNPWRESTKSVITRGNDREETMREVGSCVRRMEEVRRVCRDEERSPSEGWEWQVRGQDVPSPLGRRPSTAVRQPFNTTCLFHIYHLRIDLVLMEF